MKPRVKSGATFAEATLEAIPDRTTAAVGRLTGLAYTLTNADLRARVHEVTAGSYEFGAEWLRTIGDERELPMPPEHLARVIHALVEGSCCSGFSHRNSAPTRCSFRRSRR